MEDFILYIYIYKEISDRYFQHIVGIFSEKKVLVLLWNISLIMK